VHPAYWMQSSLDSPHGTCNLPACLKVQVFLIYRGNEFLSAPGMPVTLRVQGQPVAPSLLWGIAAVSRYTIPHSVRLHLSCTHLPCLSPKALLLPKAQGDRGLPIACQSRARSAWTRKGNQNVRPSITALPAAVCAERALLVASRWGSTRLSHATRAQV
jgi:hypothetical protein